MFVAKRIVVSWPPTGNICHNMASHFARFGVTSQPTVLTTATVCLRYVIVCIMFSCKGLLTVLVNKDIGVIPVMV